MFQLTSGKEHAVPVKPLRDVEAVAADRRWVDLAIARLHADARRSADTHLLRLPTPASSPVDIYVKDESCVPQLMVDSGTCLGGVRRSAACA